MLRSFLCHDSGGIAYHLRALRYRETLWQPFRAQVRRWLDSWQAGQEKILVVGPSAGYSLPAQWLARFSRIDILEPDPLARWLLRRRFPKLAFHAGDLDCFSSEDGPERLRQTYPDSAILFSNVIGQMADQNPIWKKNLAAAMQGTSWASYHDLVSTPRMPDRQDPVTLPAGTGFDKVLAHFWQGGELELYNHETFGLASTETAYATWSITPHQHHLVAWNCITVV